MHWLRIMSLVNSWVTRLLCLLPYCRRSGNGGPQTCLPAAHDAAPPAAPYGPSSPANTQDPREADDTRPPRGLPHQAGSRGAERSRQVTPHEVLVTQDMTTKARRAPGGSQRAQSTSFLFGAKGVSAAKESRGIKQRFPYRCNETKTSRTAGRRSPWSTRRRHHQSLWQAKTTFSQDNLY